VTAARSFLPNDRSSRPLSTYYERATAQAREALAGEAEIDTITGLVGSREADGYQVPLSVRRSRRRLSSVAHHPPMPAASATSRTTGATAANEAALQARMPRATFICALR